MRVGLLKVFQDELPRQSQNQEDLDGEDFGDIEGAINNNNNDDDATDYYQYQDEDPGKDQSFFIVLLPPLIILFDSLIMLISLSNYFKT